MPGLLDLAASFLLLGSTSFGGLWAALNRVETVLVDQRHWLTRAELHQYLAISTVVPGPSFVALAGLIGFRKRGLLGGAVSIAALVLPSCVMIVILMLFLPQAWIAAGLGKVGRTVAVAVAGILLGTAIRTGSGAGQWQRGLPLAAGVAVLIALGVPTVLALLAGMIAGRWLLKSPPAAAEVQK